MNGSEDESFNEEMSGVDSESAGGWVMKEDEAPMLMKAQA